MAWNGNVHLITIIGTSQIQSQAKAFKEGDGQPQAKLTFLLISSPLALSITYDQSLPGYVNYQGQLKVGHK